MVETDERRRSAATAVALLRVGYGGLMAVAPRRMLRLQTGEDPAGFAVWLARAFGIRDAVLGAGVLLAGDEQARRGWVTAGITADGVDCASALTGARWLGGRNAAIVSVSAATATAAQVWSLRSRPSSP